jgi:hypothetical protein
MSIQLKLRGGTTTQHSTFTGLAREVTVDTDKNTLVVHDGSTAGGVPLLTSATDSTTITRSATNPATGTDGDMVFNTTDGQLYIHNGTAFELAVDPVVGVAANAASAPSTTDLLAGAMYWNQDTEKLYVLEVDTSTTPDTKTWTQAVPSVVSSGNGIVTTANVNGLTGMSEGEVAFQTTDDKLYRYTGSAWISSTPTTDLTGYIAIGQIDANTINANHIQADAITAGKILAGEIGTSHLAANSITAGTIATNAITSDKILANAITAGKINAGEITSTHLATNAILANNITAGALTMAKMTSTSELVTNGVTVQLGTGASINNITAGGAYDSGSSSKYGLLAVNSAAGNALGAATTGTSSGNSAVVGVGSANSAFSSWTAVGALGTGAAGVSASRSGSTIAADLATSTHAGYFAGDVTVTGTYNPFTGSHDALINPGEGVEGDIVVDVEVIAKSGVSDTFTKVAVSSSANQKGVVGVYAKTQDKAQIYPLSISTVSQNDVPGSVLKETVRSIKPEYSSTYAAHDLISMNSLGEGQINICGEAGNLEIGDLIVSSSMPGKGMKQSDDIIRATTVAKVRESVTFTSSGEVKQVACIYLCG